jgi:hypothetical protein
MTSSTLKIDIRIQEFEKLTKFPGIFCAPTNKYVNFNRMKNCLPMVLTVSTVSVFIQNVEWTHVVYSLLIYDSTVIMVVHLFCDGIKKFSKVKPFWFQSCNLETKFTTKPLYA